MSVDLPPSVPQPEQSSTGGVVPKDAKKTETPSQPSGTLGGQSGTTSYKVSTALPEGTPTELQPKAPTPPQHKPSETAQPQHKENLAASQLQHKTTATHQPALQTGVMELRILARVPSEKLKKEILQKDENSKLSKVMDLQKGIYSCNDLKTIGFVKDDLRTLIQKLNTELTSSDDPSLQKTLKELTKNLDQMLQYSKNKYHLASFGVYGKKSADDLKQLALNLDPKKGFGSFIAVLPKEINNCPDMKAIIQCKNDLKTLIQKFTSMKSQISSTDDPKLNGRLEDLIKTLDGLLQKSRHKINELDLQNIKTTVKNFTEMDKEAIRMEIANGQPDLLNTIEGIRSDVKRVTDQNTMEYISKKLNYLAENTFIPLMNEMLSLEEASKTNSDDPQILQRKLGSCSGEKLEDYEIYKANLKAYSWEVADLIKTCVKKSEQIKPDEAHQLMKAQEEARKQITQLTKEIDKIKNEEFATKIRISELEASLKKEQSEPVNTELVTEKSKLHSFKQKLEELNLKRQNLSKIIH